MYKTYTQKQIKEGYIAGFRQCREMVIELLNDRSADLDLAALIEEIKVLGEGPAEPT